MTNIAFWAAALTGGAANALDAIPVLDLTDGDMAIVQTTTKVYFYIWDDSSSASESSPDVINPDDNTGNGRWLLTDGGARPIEVARPSGGSITSYDLIGNKFITNAGATGDTNNTLPAGADGYAICFLVAENYYLKVTAAADETIRYSKNQSDAAGYVRTDIVGRYWEMKWINGEWNITDMNGVMKMDE